MGDSVDNANVGQPGRPDNPDGDHLTIEFLNDIFFSP